VKHYPAIALAMLPALAYLALVVVKNLFGPFAVPPGEDSRLVLQTLRCLANGFLISGLLWAAALAMILDGRLRAAAGYFAVAGLCALVGVIHSPLADERIDLPWAVLAAVAEPFRAGVTYQSPYHWAAAYGLMALTLVGLSLGRPEVRSDPASGTMEVEPNP
jgi:adenine/guanine/hypoxanthine permease